MHSVDFGWSCCPVAAGTGRPADIALRKAGNGGCLRSCEMAGSTSVPWQETALQRADGERRQGGARLILRQRLHTVWRGPLQFAAFSFFQILWPPLHWGKDSERGGAVCGGVIKTVAMILAGGAGTRLMALSDQRAKPAVPFAGKFRIIDFALSNCIHSGISAVGVLTQYQPHSLQQHIGIGKPWDLDRVQGGVRILQPYTTPGAQAWYSGTADAIRRNRFFIDGSEPDLVLILSGDHIYRMNYMPMLRQHQDAGADLTVAVMPVPLEESPRFGIMQIDADGRVTAFHEKPPGMDKGNLASMGIYVFSRTRLLERLEEDGPDTPRADFGLHVIPAMIEAGDRVFAYEFDSYWVDVGTIDSYWNANLELLQPEPPLNLHAGEWPVLTRSMEQPPVKLASQAEVSSSLLCNGSVIKGRVCNSVISPGVVVSAGAVVENSVLMNDTWVGPGAYVENAVIDKSVIVSAGARVGTAEECPPNRDTPDMLCSGVSVVGRNSFIPSRLQIGGNVLVGSNVDSENFPEGQEMLSGVTVLNASA